jgi:hypothetical protein
MAGDRLAPNEEITCRVTVQAAPLAGANINIKKAQKEGPAHTQVETNPKYFSSKPGLLKPSLCNKKTTVNRGGLCFTETLNGETFIVVCL